MHVHEPEVSGEQRIEGWALEFVMFVDEMSFGRCYGDFCAETVMSSIPNESFDDDACVDSLFLELPSDSSIDTTQPVYVGSHYSQSWVLDESDEQRFGRWMLESECVDFSPNDLIPTSGDACVDSLLSGISFVLGGGYAIFILMILLLQRKTNVWISLIASSPHI